MSFMVNISNACAPKYYIEHCKARHELVQKTPLPHRD